MRSVGASSSAGRGASAAGRGVCNTPQRGERWPAGLRSRPPAREFLSNFLSAHTGQDFPFYPVTGVVLSDYRGAPSST
ncbi:hypothetical protein CJBVI_1999 [Corynebacterium jeikeium]|nr:hypothetical protein CJBVI_1999 [Corynebacterium jeikeium]